MTIGILLAGIIVVACVFLNRATQKAGLPVLVAFIGLGLLFGTDGILGIYYEDYETVEKICTVALIFIIFYGGFGTNWKHAKPVVSKAILLSTLGVLFTALLTGLFCHYVLHFGLLESFLIGSVISSTDAASVFSILRSKRLGLKYNTDSLLEIESGSNDPTSYTLTILVLTMMTSGIQLQSTLQFIILQFAMGIFFGFIVAYGATYILKKIKLTADGFDLVFLVGIALVSYAVATYFNGNGYLSVYITGIILGNQKMTNQKAFVHFFDGITGLMQMVIFFLLGFLATPSRIPDIFIPAILIMIFLTVVARPFATFLLLKPYGCKFKQLLLVSFAGLRGAASIVFAILATVRLNDLSIDLYHIVFFIVLLSILIQGTFLPKVSKWLDMTDKNIDVLKSFSDYSDEVDLRFIKVNLNSSHNWINQEIKNITLPPDTLIILILRNKEKIIPSGKTILQEGDQLILSAYKYRGENQICLQEYIIEKGSEWIQKTIKDFSPKANELVIMIIRDSKTILPSGDTKIEEEDILVLYTNELVR
ncbi:potassium/proton antiporter [Anaerorhabdus sp.]|uniref:potassium/proton antiporter n=1 Tax=Anaerorhabdus sp. TaxID=1872524 RepID=UPI002B203931|nr:potassium/proton antiporter [Anaerorhabdus sp.]MEA4874437.1 potassium/proton antiporter [Anaerorhabdus sp.]